MLSAMNSTEDALVVPVTARTEYETSRQRRCSAAGATVGIAALIALVSLNYAGAPAPLTAVVAAVLVTTSLGAITYRRLLRPGAVVITVGVQTVQLGDESDQIVDFPLSALTAVDRTGPADATTPAPRRLTVAGQPYLTLTFRTETGTDEWRVAVVESDPAAKEILARLRAALPDAGPEPKPAPEPARPTARIADAGTDAAARRLWDEATRRHDEVLGAYGAYELDPATLLRYPAITDVTVEQTQNFHLALDEAGALRTEAYPGNRSLADAYQQAVVGLRRAWIACESHGKRVGTDHLAPADRADLDTALKLYQHAASSSTPTEQATYYERVRQIVTKLVDRGILHPPKAQLAQLEGITRRAIEAARTH